MILWLFIKTETNISTTALIVSRALIDRLVPKIVSNSQKAAYSSGFAQAVN